MDSSRYEAARAEIEDLHKPEVQGDRNRVQDPEDEFNYIWVVLKDKDLDDLVTNIQVVSQILMEQGFGTQLLASVYRFKGENIVYWIYSFKLRLSFRAERQPAEEHALRVQAEVGGDGKRAANRKG